VRRRILLERRTAAPCHPGEPNREMTAGRDPLRRHTHFFRSRRPVPLPEHTAASGRRRDQRHDTRNQPSAVEADQFYAVKARRIWSWPPMPAPSRSVAIRCGGSPARGPIRHHAGGLGPKPWGATTASSQQAPWALIRTFARPGLSHGRTQMTQHDTPAAVADAEALPQDL
jgi:hypothetical protein